MLMKKQKNSRYRWEPVKKIKAGGGVQGGGRSAFARCPWWPLLPSFPPSLLPSSPLFLLPSFPPCLLPSLLPSFPPSFLPSLRPSFLPSFLSSCMVIYFFFDAFLFFFWCVSPKTHLPVSDSLVGSSFWNMLSLKTPFMCKTVCIPENIRHSQGCIVQRISSFCDQRHNFAACILAITAPLNPFHFSNLLKETSPLHVSNAYKDI